MKSPVNPTSCKVLVPRKGNQAGRAADVRTGAIPSMEFGGCAGMSRSVERTRIGLVKRSMGVAKLPEKLKPVSAGKWFPSAPAGLSGVKGGGTCRRVGWEHERAAVAAGACARRPVRGNHNRDRCGVRQSERPIVARKRLTTAERRGLGREHAESEATGADWRKPKTEEAAVAADSIGSRDRSWAARPSCALTGAMHVGQRSRSRREPDAGNPHVRFDEGEGGA